MSGMAEPSRTHEEPAAPRDGARVSEAAPVPDQGPAPEQTIAPEQTMAPELAPDEGPQDAKAAAGVAELRERVAFLEDQWRRALADLDNVRKRQARDVERSRTEERARLAAQWLPVLDNLDRALAHADTAPDAVVEGVRAVRDQAVAIVASMGFPRQDVEPGERFDPARHEAVATVPTTDAPEGTVLNVVLPGYGDQERQLRPAAVVVAIRSG